ncbi:hypothetical protein [Marinobacter vulgaris]|nr:hypothetical protein [Marinobacter vulgaris]
MAFNLPPIATLNSPLLDQSLAVLREYLPGEPAMRQPPPLLHH